MLLLRVPTNARRVAGLYLTVCLGWLLPAVPARAVTSAEADAAFRALNKVYWDPAARYFRKEEQGPKMADFWFAAQLWDTVMDEYDRRGGEEVKRQIDEAYDGFVRKYPDWTTNKYNDDIMWWAVACARAYRITHDERYLKKAKASFDFVYDHFSDDATGGGLYWTSDRTSKNSCVNCPAVIAAVRLSVLLKDPGYLEKAKSLYAWQKKTLTDGAGKVFDNVRYDPQNDPSGNAQNLSLLQGKILRIDVDHPGPGKGYSVPKDNPFVDRPGVRPEIWSYGHREVWRFAFDPVTGDLWEGDVGQDLYEEVNIIRKGENYGWNVYEGFERFSNKYRRDGEKYVPPVFAYTRKYGQSVTGGYVYRGNPKSSFYGAYVFGDYQQKRLFAMTQRDRSLEKVRVLTGTQQSVV